MAGGGGALEVLAQIQALVADKLQVVSYKWLSRNFSVSSNCAKRLLQEFVEKHGNELEVLYTLSGWLKISPQTYCIRLATGHNLSEAKQQFKDSCSVQVYSVQACIPKDLAVLWSTEFVQAEELFSQPTDAENCFRDNRFCGVSNSFVKRNVDGKSLGAALPQSKISPRVDMQSKSKSMIRDPPFQPSKPEQITPPIAKAAGQSCSATTSCEKSGSIAQKVTDQTIKPHVVKESASTVNKRKNQNEKPSSGNGGSLASLWGRASAKPKPSSPAIESSVSPNIAHPAEAPAVKPKPSSPAKESCVSPNIAHPAEAPAVHAEDAPSSDDERETMSFRRDSNGAGIRKRRVVMDFSDEDNEEENVARLASPEPPNGQLFLDLLHKPRNAALEKKDMPVKEHKTDALDVQANTKDRTSGLSSEDNRQTESKRIDAGITLHKKTPTPEGLGDQSKKDKAIVSSSNSPKRRKVLKTRIDERGREVTEVVWEGEVAGTVSTDNNTGTGDCGVRALAANKVPANNAASNASTKPPSKAVNNKQAKGGGKNPKQGNIMSFFKKV